MSERSYRHDDVRLWKIGHLHNVTFRQGSHEGSCLDSQDQRHKKITTYDCSTRDSQEFYLPSHSAFGGHQLKIASQH